MIIFVLGGARSGKSVVAESRAARTRQPVTYVATMRASDDQELAERIAEHQRRRPLDWVTKESGDDLVGVLSSTAGTVLIDSLGPWLASLDDMRADIASLLEALRARAGDTIIVSEEVGFGVHPESLVGRTFRDALGTLNQAVSAVADEVLLVVAGRALALPPTES